MGNIAKYFKQNYKMFFLIFLFFLFFSFSMTIAYDSSNYIIMAKIFDGEIPWQQWDSIRGLFFPLLIFLSRCFLGRNIQGLILLSFIFYFVMLFFIDKIVNQVLEYDHRNIKHVIVKCSIFFLIIFNPIVLGYFHSLLTEFPAITMSMIMCYLAWKWLYIEKFFSWKQLLYLLLFSFLCVCSWSLKQPYVTISLIPIITACSISIISNFKLKNVFYRVSTILICVIMLIVSINITNQFLVYKGVEMKADRSSSSALGGQLVASVDKFRLEKDDIFFTSEYIQNNSKLSSQEKIQLLNNPSKFRIVSILNKKNEIVDQTLVASENNIITGIEGLKFIAKQFLYHPILVTSSYINNYLALIKIFPVRIENNKYVIEKKISIDYGGETNYIAYGAFESDLNIYPNLTKEQKEAVYEYTQMRNTPLIQRNLMKILQKPYTLLFAISFLILPFVLVISLFMRILKRFKEFSRIIDLVIIMLSFSFLHIAAHAFTGAIIDRYASPAFVPTIISYILLIYVIFSTCIRKKRSKNYEE